MGVGVNPVSDSSRTPPAARVAPEQVWSALAHIPDPEIPVISIVDLGVVADVRVEGGRVEVDFTPTFMGCPALETMRTRPGPAAVLIGPEGGFDADERDAIRAHPQAVGIGLGPRILRADTAAAAAVALWMAAAGDWR